MSENNEDSENFENLLAVSNVHSNTLWIVKPVNLYVSASPPTPRVENNECSKLDLVYLGLLHPHRLHG